MSRLVMPGGGKEGVGWKEEIQDDMCTRAAAYIVLCSSRIFSMTCSQLLDIMRSLPAVSF